MSLNSRVMEALKPLKLPITVAENPIKPKDTFLVIIPQNDQLDGYSDDKPSSQLEEAQLAIYTKGNYLSLRDDITRRLLAVDIMITGRRYIEYETETKYHHYVIDVMVVNLL